MIDQRWFDDYLDRYRRAFETTEVFEKCLQLRELAIKVRDTGGKLMIAGNGASASIASHAAADFTKQGKVPAMTFHDPDWITMMANDFGYDRWVAESIRAYHTSNDAVVLISSSGSSQNIINAAKQALDMEVPVVTFSGFEKSNPLAQLGHINFWLDSRAYNIIENIHSIWITTVIDMLIGSAEYSVK